MQKRLVLLLCLILGNIGLIKAQYITEVIEYRPAPGQLINKEPWGVPASAESIIGGVNGSLTLGAFGGYVIFRFEEAVENNPDNPFGVDFTIFGNPLTDWSEPGVVYVMKDENGNGKPDGTWYQLAGSDYFFSSTNHNYEVTYFNPGKDYASDVPWTDNYDNSGFIYTTGHHEQPYYPLHGIFPGISADQYTLTGTHIEGAIETNEPPVIKSYKRAFGYADNQLRGNTNSHLPDNPYTHESENMGGDAFDISWAVDENGNYVDLDKIHFVKVQTGVLANAGWMGEVSAEITGAVVSEPGSDITGVLDIVVIKDLPAKITTGEYQLEAYAFHRGRVKPGKTINWSTNMPGATIDENMMLTVTEPGDLTLTAALAENPEVASTVYTTVNLEGDDDTSTYEKSAEEIILIYPNPASGFVKFQNVNNATIRFFNTTGNIVLEIDNYQKGESISIKALPKGVYIVEIKPGSFVTTLKLLKH